MINLNSYLIEKLVIDKNVTRYKYHPKDKDELQNLINKLIEEKGNDADLNDIDVSNVTNMSFLFKKSTFNGDISKWDVSKVKTMESMFEYSEFNQDISKWNVSKVENMSYMFCMSDFNGDISKWDVSNVTNMKYMFLHNSKFNGDISSWNISDTDMTKMFSNCPLEKNPPKWYHV